ncbi:MULTISPECIES: bifunctional diguanylate cyclase/phosphodiesterase [unclassified Shewanella]|uniref:putative bifunctional diguanylate cyclase/phosphodiesterase n=1 Tax=unclassified Shewanella TaxID=196818 RepID=UPI001BB88103|nr:MULTISPECIES: bifunctional diguanylate cyclase/phosphodiesterase [unclassified Shewanella]GIU07095.1 GGDEF domain-containing protein [Shewanella sp. MBTL60-112-B1]GIU35458.1 GGDEF domain-containing protein [Shewanella sp. MBTL60-112-B2]
MINIEITQAQLGEWQQSIDMLARIAQCGAALLQVDQDDKFVAISHANITVEQLNKLQVSREQLYQYSELATKKDALVDDETVQAIDSSLKCLLPINWPSGALFGYICVNNTTEQAKGKNQSEISQHLALPLTSSQADNRADLRKFLRVCAGSIEQDLALMLRQSKLESRQPHNLDEQATLVSLQAFIDCMKEHVWMKDALGRYILVNQSVELAWDRPREQILNLTDDELFEPRLAKHFIASDMESIRKGVEVSIGECEGLDIGDVDSWLETTKVPVINDDGELAGVIGISRNISSHKAAKDQLELASRVFENSVEGVIITDVDGAIIDAHGAFSEITGYAKEELIGQNPRLLNSGRHEKAFFTKMWGDLLSKGKWHGEIWNRRKSGAIFPQMLNISAVYDDEHQIRFFVAVFNDISAQKQSEAKLAEVALHDPLTKLPNRMALSARLEQELKQACHTQNRLGLVYIDVDLFKQINESYGHPMGDEVLLELSQRFKSGLDNLTTAARLGSDEFAVILSNIDSRDMLLLSVNKLRKMFDQPFTLGEHGQARLTASMGVAIYPDDGQDSSSLMVNAEVAMHRAKHDGRNNYAYYTESLTQESVAKLKLQSALHDAFELDAFHLVYQPKISLITGKIVGFEALLRWSDPVLGSISPAVFIPLAEKIGLIQDIGRWVLKRACEQGQRWHQQGVSFGRIAVNIAGQQIQRSSFVDEVAETLKETGLPASSLEIEVTESCMMSEPELVSQDLAKLGDMGIEVSIDDFGTGYSSLSYLKKLPIHKLKIDQSFVAGLPFDTHNTAIAKAIIAMGHALNLKVVAEGVETQAQVDFLIDSECDHAQGYFYSKPKRVEELTTFLHATTTD